MSNELKLTPEELQQITDLQKSINQNIFELGQVHIKVFNLSEQEKVVNQELEGIMSLLKTLSDTESKLLQSIELKYGRGTIDATTGKITLV